VRVILPTGTAGEYADAKQAGEPGRGVVVATDMGGLRPRFEAIAKRIADAQKCAVIAVDPFGRLPDVDPAGRRAAMARLTDRDVLQDLAAARDVLGGSDVAVVGFCLGGMFALKAASLRAFSRVVAFYGMTNLPPDVVGPRLQPASEVLRDGGVNVPTLLIAGGQDEWTPKGDLEALRSLGVEVVVFDHAGHAFAHDPENPAYREDDATRAWELAFQFLGGPAASSDR
jgi:dienelactone hydrolase